MDRSYLNGVSARNPVHDKTAAQGIGAKFPQDCCYVLGTSLIVSDGLDFSRLEKFLSPAEVARAKGFIKERDRQRFAIGRALARVAISDYLEVGLDGIAFELSENGKPEITGSLGRKVAFSISHAREQVLVAVVKGSKAGLDIEMLRPAEEILELRDTVLSVMELSQCGMQSISAEMVSRSFSAKEAILKLYGVGLAGGMTTFSLPELIPPQGQGWAPVGTPWGTAYLTCLATSDGYCGYLALDQPAKRVLQKVISLNDLFEAVPTAATRPRAHQGSPHRCGSAYGSIHA